MKQKNAAAVRLSDVTGPAIALIQSPLRCLACSSMDHDKDPTRPRSKSDESFRRRHPLSWLLDNSIPLPGGFRICIDGIIGLIPGVGDMLGGFLSTLILYQAYRQNIPRMVLARMVINVLIDTAIGAIPVVGDLFDFFWKANLRNAQLMDSYQRDPDRAYRRSAATTLAFIGGVMALVALIVLAVVSLLSMVLRLLTG